MNRKNIKDLFNYVMTISNPPLKMRAIFSDETANFVSPVNIDFDQPFEVRIQTGKDVDEVFLCTKDEKFSMSRRNLDEMFDIFYIKISGQKEKFDYYFEIHGREEIFFYNKLGLCESLNTDCNFCVTPGFITPDWLKGSVMYQIYVDRFFNGDKKNDVVNNEYIYLGKSAKKIDDWSEPVSSNNDICNFYGGDLQGVIEKIDYLKDLGIEVIYFNPIFVSPSTHKYDTQDYDYIDPHYGKIVNDGGEPLYFEKFKNKFASKYIQRTTDKKNLEASNELFIKLVEIAHKNNIKVILDGVFNHCGAFHKWLDKENFYGAAGYPDGAYLSEKSIYHDYFRWFDSNWPNNDCYDSWWGFDNHPKLNYENSQKLFDYIMSIAAKWVSPPFNADGWRIDVAADVGTSREFNHRFWRAFRESVKKANPNAVIIAEHYGNPKEWLRGDQWDSVMNYDAFMEPITWFLTGMEKHSEEFRNDKLCNIFDFKASMEYFMAQFTYQSLYCAMNELSNHDHSRFLTRTNKTVGRLHTMGHKAAEKNINKNIMMEAVVFQMTWPGCPTIYYGDEVGLAGWSDPDNRRPFPWDNQDKILLELHKFLISLHKKSKALKYGSVRIIETNNYGVITFARWLDKEKFLILLNNSQEDADVKISVREIGLKDGHELQRLIKTENNNFSTEKEKFVVSNGKLRVRLVQQTSIILKFCDVKN